EIRWDRSQMLRVRPEGVCAHRERLRIRRDEHDRRARRERAATRAKNFDELARKNVFREVPRVEAVDAPCLHLTQMRERVDLVRLEALLTRLRDHARAEVDPIPSDPLVLEELQKDAAARPEVEHALAPLIEVDERLGLPSYDRLVTAEARLEVDGVKVCRDLVLAPFLPHTLEPLEARSEARRH